MGDEENDFGMENMNIDDEEEAERLRLERLQKKHERKLKEQREQKRREMAERRRREMAEKDDDNRGMKGRRAYGDITGSLPPPGLLKF